MRMSSPARLEHAVELGDERGGRLVDGVPHRGEHGARARGEEGARHAEDRVVAQVARGGVRARENDGGVRAQVRLAHRVHEEQALVHRRHLRRVRPRPRLLALARPLRAAALLGDRRCGGGGVGHRGRESDAAGARVRGEVHDGERRLGQLREGGG